MRRDRRDDAGLPVRGRAQVEGDPAGAQLVAQLGVVDGARAVGDALGLDDERAADLVRAAPLPGMDRHAQAVGPSGLEGPRVVERVGVGGLGSGEVPAGQPLVEEPRRGLGQLHVPLGVVGTQRGADEAHDRAGSGGAVARARAHGRDPVRQGEAARDVQARTPADLDVAHAVRGLGLDELPRDALERVGVLHQRDRQVERAQQLRLVGARHRGDQGRGHAGPVRRRIDAARPGELEGRVHPQRTVEVEVQLGLRHRLDEAAAGLGLAVDRRGRHRPMLRFPRLPTLASLPVADPRRHRSRPTARAPIRQILLALAWLVAVVLIALGAAGLVAGMDVPATAGSRPWLTARDDVVVAAAARCDRGGPARSSRTGSMPSASRDAARSRRWSPTTRRPRPPRSTKATDSWRTSAVPRGEDRDRARRRAAHRHAGGRRTGSGRRFAIGTRGWSRPWRPPGAWRRRGCSSPAGPRLRRACRISSPTTMRPSSPRPRRDATPSTTAALTILDDADTAIADARAPAQRPGADRRRRDPRRMAGPQRPIRRRAA